MIDWILDNRHAAMVTWFGTISGLIGLLLTVIGLVIALVQLRKIVTATEAAQRAIDKVQFKVSAINISDECKNALHCIADIRKNYKDRDWDNIIECYQNLMNIFSSICHSLPDLTTEDRNILIKCSSDMAKICEAIRKRSTEEPNLFLRGHDSQIRKFNDIVTKINYSITRELQR